MLLLVQRVGSARELALYTPRNADRGRQAWRRGQVTEAPGSIWHAVARTVIIDEGTWATAQSFPRRPWPNASLARE
jgi:hypothetical protein